MLLNIHDGPFTQYGERFFDEAQIQARAGYVVVLSNPRGGSGRDTAWGRAICGPKHRAAGTGWGSVDADDCMAVVDEALRRFGFVDPGHVGVLGGYMTTWLTTHTDRFAAGCSERSANNLLALEQTSDCGGSFHSLVGVGHLDDSAEYLRMSPITHVADLACPLLIVHSAGDLRCPVTQGRRAVPRCHDAGQRRRVRAVPRRVPRAVTLGYPGAPPATGRHHPRVLRPPPRPNPLTAPISLG